MPIRRYRVVETPDGALVGGACVTERFELAEDQIERIPPVLSVLVTVLRLVPPDRIVRSAEVTLAWHAPGRLDVGRLLWNAIRYEWSDRATHIAGNADARGPLAEMFRADRMPGPRVRLVAPIYSPTPIDESRPVYLAR